MSEPPVVTEPAPLPEMATISPRGLPLPDPATSSASTRRPTARPRSRPRKSPMSTHVVTDLRLQHSELAVQASSVLTEHVGAPDRQRVVLMLREQLHLGGTTLRDRA